VLAGPESNETPGPEAVAHRDLRASHDDREEVIGTLKTAFMQGRLTEDELSARAGQVYAARTYAELAGITADIPDEPAGRSRRRRDPWRATRIAWRVEYSLFLPGIVTLLVLPGGPRIFPAEAALVAAVVYFIFWTLGIAMMVVARRSDPALEDREQLHAAHAVARDQVIRVLGSALAQGRLTEEEHAERSALVPASRSWTDLDALVADLPPGLANQPPKARDVKAGLCASGAAASVLAAILLWQPDNPVAFLLALMAIAILVVAPVVTVGLWADVRHQKRSRRRRPA
jgi:hypothetical protein